jgi:hypothetical protein
VTRATQHQSTRRQEVVDDGVWIDMRSYPLVESTLSQTQQQFDHFVDSHVTGSDALYEADGDGSLPGDTVKMTVTSRNVLDDVAESRRTVEFMSLDADGHWATAGCIGHSVKEVEALQGHVQLESTFVIAGLGIPEGRYRHSDVEPFVRAQLDHLEAARLLPMRSRIANAGGAECAA